MLYFQLLLFKFSCHILCGFGETIMNESVSRTKVLGFYVYYNINTNFYINLNLFYKWYMNSYKIFKCEVEPTKKVK